MLYLKKVSNFPDFFTSLIIYKTPYAKNYIMKVLQSIFAITLSIFLISNTFAQDAKNIKVSTTDKDIIVTYDLEGKPGAIYLVDLSFEGDAGKTFLPESLKGDVGEVEAGTDKVVIWKVYDDVNGLDGSITPVFDIKEKMALPKTADKPTVQDTPTPKNPDDKVKVDDIIDMAINRGKKSNERFGVKASFGNANAIANNRSGSWNQDFSWEAGLFYRYSFNRKLYIQPELLYHKTKFSEEFSETISKKYNMDQIRGQLIGGIKPIGLGLYFNAGLYAAANAGGFTETNDGGTSSKVRFSDFDNADDKPFNQFDFGYILGGSISFNKGAFALGVLYSRSFDNTLNNDSFAGNEAYENLSLHNRTVHFVIQKRFKSKKGRKF